ncbi:MAG TPA: hypothetical protein VIM50_01085 [Candidatus Limnocylindria bacterium]|jgi:hypothetical protein
MTGRDPVIALGALVIAVGIAAILLVGSMSAAGPDGARERFFFVNFASRSVPIGRPANTDGSGVPVPLRAVVPFQRGVSDAARDAAGYLLAVIGVAAVFVLGRDQVLGVYRASRGGWRAQLRVVGMGVAVLLVFVSASFLGGVALLGTVATGFRGAPAGIQLGLQVGLMTMAVFAAGFLLIALIGFTAASWRLGDIVFGLGPLRRWAGGVPAAVIALLGATVLYVLMQLPVIGGVIALAILAYALGAVVVARLGTSSAATG